MKNIIFDWDNSSGIPGKPMDDGLTLMYLLGRRAMANVLGLCCTFGNDTSAAVYSASKRLLGRIGREDIPLLPGAEPDEDPRSPAAKFILDTVNARPGEISILATGSMTNLYGAWLMDNRVFDRVREIVIMGGYTAPLLYHGVHLDELNCSVNPKAAALVLNKGRNISILTGNNTLEPSYLPEEEFISRMLSGGRSGRFIAEQFGYRFEEKAVQYADAASYCWDVVAAIYMLKPELYEDVHCHCYVTEKGMHAGWLGLSKAAGDTAVLNLPRVKDLAKYREEMYSGWLDFQLPEGQ